MDQEKAKMARTVLNRILDENKKDLDAFGVAAHVGHGTFDKTGITFKVELREINDDGIVETKERQDYKTYARMFDLEQKWLDDVFESTNGKMYKVIGLMPRSQKYPVLVEELETGKEFKFPDKAVIRAFGMKPEKPNPKTPPKSPKETKPKAEESKATLPSATDLVSNILESMHG